MSKASIELYSALTTLGLDPQHATRAAEAVEGIDQPTRVEVRVHSILLTVIMAGMLIAVWNFLEMRNRMTLVESRMAAVETRMNGIETQLRTLTQAVNRIAPPHLEK